MRVVSETPYPTPRVPGDRNAGQRRGGAGPQEPQRSRKFGVREELLPLFSDHLLATEEGVRSLREHDRSIIIVATNDAYDKQLVLYGADLIEQQRKAGKTDWQVRPIPVNSFIELQFVIAAVAKFVGVPSTDDVQCKDL